MMEQKRVLFADDDADFRDFMRDAVSEVSTAIGVDIIITEAKDGKEAITLFDESCEQKNPFDFVVTDYKMPIATGIDVIRHIVNTSPVPIIVISGHKEAEVVDFIREGAIIFVSKPFQFEKMCSAFQAAISLSLSKDDIHKVDDAIRRLESLL